jgi:replicative DNA helicase
LIVAKHRAGPTADIPLHFEPEQTRFDDATRQYA